MKKVKMILGLFVLLIIFIIIIILLQLYNKSIHLNSITQLEEVLDVDLPNSNILDVHTKNSIGNTNIIIYYEVPNSEISNNQYYQYSEDYNPLPSYNGEYYASYIKDYMLYLGLEKNDISYTNVFKKSYHINKILGEEILLFGMKFYILSNEENESSTKIILLVDVPYKIILNF